MRTKYIDVYADYIIKYLEAYEAEGIHISAVTPQNEPVPLPSLFPICTNRNHSQGCKAGAYDADT